MSGTTPSNGAAPAGAATAPAAGPPRLLRVLTLWDLIFYGMVIIQPTAPMPLFGVVHKVAQGHVATTLLIGMVAMMLTAVSYGRMARAYPSAGSSYTFVGRELGPVWGFLTGWSIVMDYTLNPAIGTIWCSRAAMNVLPLPFPVWAVFFASLFTFMNLRGIRASARTNMALSIGMCAVVAVFFAAAIRYLVGDGGVSALVSIKPFYDPATFSWAHVSTGASIAVLTYMGFDGVSTLSEEVENPRRNIMLATVLLCLITGVLGCLQVYMGQLVWPDYWSFPNEETAFVSAAGRAGGPLLFHLMNITLLVATIGSSAGAQTGAVRLLFAMGRDSVLPSRLFGHLHPVRRTPAYNALLTGAVALTCSLTLSYQTGVELLNFGAFIAFMSVNVAAIARYYVRGESRGLRSVLVNLIPPLAGFLVCFGIWLGLRTPAKIAGGCWMLLGLGYCAWKTGFFASPIVLRDVGPESAEREIGRI